MCFRNSPEVFCLVSYLYRTGDVTRRIGRLVPGDDGFYDLVVDADMTNVPTDWPIDPERRPGEGSTYLLPSDDGEGGPAWTVCEGEPILPEGAPLAVVMPYA